MNSGKSNNLSWKYERCKPSVCNTIKIKKYVFCGKDLKPFLKGL